MREQLIVNKTKMYKLCKKIAMPLVFSSGLYPQMKDFRFDALTEGGKCFACFLFGMDDWFDVKFALWLEDGIVTLRAYNPFDVYIDFELFPELVNELQLVSDK